MEDKFSKEDLLSFGSYVASDSRRARVIGDPENRPQDGYMSEHRANVLCQKVTEKDVNAWLKLEVYGKGFINPDLINPDLAKVSLNPPVLEYEYSVKSETGTPEVNIPEEGNSSGLVKEESKEIILPEEGSVHNPDNPEPDSGSLRDYTQ